MTFSLPPATLNQTSTALVPLNVEHQLFLFVFFFFSPLPPRLLTLRNQCVYKYDSELPVAASLLVVLTSQRNNGDSLFMFQGSRSWHRVMFPRNTERLLVPLRPSITREWWLRIWKPPVPLGRRGKKKQNVSMVMRNVRGTWTYWWKKAWGGAKNVPSNLCVWATYMRMCTHPPADLLPPITCVERCHSLQP